MQNTLICIHQRETGNKLTFIILSLKAKAKCQCQKCNRINEKVDIIIEFVDR